MKNLFLTIMLALLPGVMATAETKTVSSPDGKLVVTIDSENGKAFYSVKYNNKQMIERSQLGVVANIADFTNGLTLVKTDEKRALSGKSVEPDIRHKAQTSDGDYVQRG